MTFVFVASFIEPVIMRSPFMNIHNNKYLHTNRDKTVKSKLFKGAGKHFKKQFHYKYDRLLITNTWTVLEFKFSNFDVNTPKPYSNCKNSSYANLIKLT